MDVVVDLPEWPGPDEKHRAGSIVTLPGGQAATVAVGCVRLGLRAVFVGVVGDDANGRALREALEAEGVEVAVLERRGVPTRGAIVLVGPDGRRTVLEHRDSRLGLVPDDVDAGPIASARALMVDATDPSAALAAVRAARRMGVATVVDADRIEPDVVDLLREIDLLVLPASTVVGLGGTEDVGEALRRLEADFAPTLAVATLGPDGSLARCRGREVRHRPPPVDVVDTTGAGDAFRAGLLAAWLGRDPEPEVDTLLAAANATAALNCRARGAQAALPGWDELARYL